MAESEHVLIPAEFSDNNLHLITPSRTFRDGDTIYSDVTVTRTEEGGCEVRGVPHPAQG